MSFNKAGRKMWKVRFVGLISDLVKRFNSLLLRYEVVIRGRVLANGFTFICNHVTKTRKKTLIMPKGRV